MPGKKTVALQLVFILWLQPLLSAIGQASVWEDRRMAEGRNLPVFQVASLTSTFPAFQNPVQRMSLPRVRFPSSVKLRPLVEQKLIDGIGATARLDRVMEPKVRIPKALAVIIQDIHQNREAEGNIATLLGHWTADGLVSAIGLEGVFGPVDLSRFAHFQYRERLARVAGYLLSANQISGVVDAAVVSPSFNRLIGIDDKPHYDANVRAYLASRRDAGQARVQLLKAGGILSARMSKIRSSALQNALEEKKSFDDGTVDLAAYVRSFTATELKGFKNAGIFVRAYSLEKALDLGRARVDRERLARDISERLTPAQSDQVAETAAAFQTGGLNETDFYRIITAVASRARLPMNHYPELAHYLVYLRLAQSIDANDLFEEIRRMEAERFDRAARSAAERDVLKRFLFHQLQEKLVQFALTPSEWSEYKAIQAGLPPDASLLSLRPFEDFYREAGERDRAMATRALETMNRYGGIGGHAAVFVVGGFHAASLAAALTEQGYAALIFTPRITSVDAAGGSAYLNSFLQGKTPLSKMFDGQKLFVRPDPLRGMAELSVAPLSGLGMPLAQSAGAAILPTGDRIISDETRQSAEGTSETRTRVEDPGGDISEVDVAWKDQSPVRIVSSSEQKRLNFRARWAFLEEVFYSGVLVGLLPWLIVHAGVNEFWFYPVRIVFTAASVCLFAWRHPEVLVRQKEGNVAPIRFSTRHDRFIVAGLGAAFRFLFLFPGADPWLAIAGALVFHAVYNIAAMARGWVLATVTSVAPAVQAVQSDGEEEVMYGSIGDLLMVEADYGFLPAAHPASRFVTSRINRLLYDVPKRDRPQVRVLASRGEGINAMVFANGVIVVTPELLEEIEYVEELDFVLLHEQTHHINRDILAISRQEGMVKQAGAARAAEYRSDAGPFWQMTDPERGTSPMGAIAVLERLRALEKKGLSHRVKWDVAHGSIDDRILNLKSISQILNFAGLDQELTPIPGKVKDGLSKFPKGGALSALRANPNVFESGAIAKRESFERIFQADINDSNAVQVKSLALGVLNGYQTIVLKDILAREKILGVGNAVAERLRANLQLMGEAVGGLKRVNDWETRGMPGMARSIVQVLSLELEAGLPILTDPESPVLNALQSGSSADRSESPRAVLTSIVKSYRMALKNGQAFRKSKTTPSLFVTAAYQLGPYSQWLTLPQIAADSALEAGQNAFDGSGEGGPRGAAAMFGAAAGLLKDLNGFAVRRGIDGPEWQGCLSSSWSSLAAKTGLWMIDTDYWAEAWDPGVAGPGKNPFLAIIQKAASKDGPKGMLKLKDQYMERTVNAYVAGGSSVASRQNRTAQSARFWSATALSIESLEERLKQLAEIKRELDRIIGSTGLRLTDVRHVALMKQARELMDRLPEDVPESLVNKYLLETTPPAFDGKIPKSAIADEFLPGREPQKIDAESLMAQIYLGQLLCMDQFQYRSFIDGITEKFSLEISMGQYHGLAEAANDFSSPAALFGLRPQWPPTYTDYRFDEAWGRTSVERLDYLASHDRENEFFEELGEVANQWRIPPTDQYGKDEFANMKKDIFLYGVKRLNEAHGTLSPESVRESPQLQRQILELSFFMEDLTIRRPLQEFLMTLLIDKATPRKAIDLVFKAYAVQGIMGGKRLLDVLDEKVTARRDIEYLSDMVRETLKTAFSNTAAAGKAVLVDGGISLFLRQEQEGDLLTALIESREQDTPLRRFLDNIWWNSYVHDINLVLYEWLESLSDDGGKPTVEFERLADSILEKRFRLSKGKGDEAAEGPSIYFSSQDALMLLYRLGPFERGALLRKLLTKALASADTRSAVFNSFFDQYIDKTTGSQATELIHLILETLVDTAPTDELVLMVGSLLEPRIGRRPLVPGSWKGMALDHAKDTYDQWDTAEDQDRIDGLTRVWFEYEDDAPDHGNRKIDERNRTIRRGFLTALRGWFEREESEGTTDSLRVPEAVELMETLVPADYLRGESSGVFTPVGLMLDVARQLGAPGVRFLQLLGQVMEIPEEYQKEFSTVYDRSRGQSHVAALETIKHYLPAYAASIDHFVRRLGGGSLYTVFEVMLTSGESEAVRVLNPNARYHARVAIQIISDTIEKMAEEDPLYAQARPLVQLLKEWIEQELSDTAFEKNDPVFREWEGWQPQGKGFSMTIGVHATIPTGTAFVRREKIVRGNNLTEVLSDDTEALRRWPPKKRKEIVALGAQHYAAQIFAPIVPSILHGRWGKWAGMVNEGVARFNHIIGALAGRPARSLIHSDISMGNLRVTADGKQLAILDRGMYLEFTPAELKFFQNVMREKEGSFEGISDFVQSLWGLSLTDDKRRQLESNGITPEALTREIAWRHVLSEDKRLGMEAQGLTQDDLTPDLVRQFRSEAGVQKIALNVLALLQQKGVHVPLKVNLLMRNINAWEDIARKAGFVPLMEGGTVLQAALEYSPRDDAKRGTTPSPGRPRGPQPGSPMLPLLPFAQINLSPSWNAALLATVVIGAVGWILWTAVRSHQRRKEATTRRNSGLSRRLTAQRDRIRDLAPAGGSADPARNWPDVNLLKLNGLNGPRGLRAVIASDSQTTELAEAIKKTRSPAGPVFSWQTALALLRLNLMSSESPEVDQLATHVATPVRLDAGHLRADLSALKMLDDRMPPGKKMVLMIDSDAPNKLEAMNSLANELASREIVWVERPGGFIIGGEVNIGLAAGELARAGNNFGSMIFVIPAGVAFRPTDSELKLFNRVQYALMENLVSLIVIDRVDAENLLRLARALSVQA